MIDRGAVDGLAAGGTEGEGAGPAAAAHDGSSGVIVGGVVTAGWVIIGGTIHDDGAS